MSIRSFVAITLSQNLANQLGDIAAKMAYQDKSNAVRWVSQDNFHLTLAFLGEQQEQDLFNLAEQLDSYLPQHSHSISVSRLSPFPEGKPKLIAAMVDADESLVDLQKKVITSINAANLGYDKRRFSPHITLGRLRHSRNHFAGGIPNNISLEDEIADVAIYESVLTPSGAEYEALFRFPLDLDYFDLNELES